MLSVMPFQLVLLGITASNIIPEDGILSIKHYWGPKRETGSRVYVAPTGLRLVAPFQYLKLLFFVAHSKARPKWGCYDPILSPRRPKK